MGPLLWRHLTQTEMSIPKQTARQLYGVYVRYRDRNRIMLDELTRIVQALEEANIDVLVLKGPALISMLYEDIGLRPLSDLDLLVRKRTCCERSVR